MDTALNTTKHATSNTAEEYTLSDLYYAWQNLAENEIIIDIRSPADYAEAHIPESRNIPYASVIDQHQGLRKYSRLYFYCYGGKGSKDVSSRLAEMGITDICYLANAGMSDWQTAGYPVSQE